MSAWQKIETAPTAKTAKEAEPVLVWHIFQGVLVSDTLTAKQNQFHVYWQPIPKTWIDPHDRLPTVEDGDTHRCVVTVDRYGMLRLMGIWMVRTPQDVLYWIPCPEPPEDAQRLRHEAYNSRR